MFVARKDLCQDFVLPGGMDWKCLAYTFQRVKRIDYTPFWFPESAWIDARASTIQYSVDKKAANANQEMVLQSFPWVEAVSVVRKAG